MSSLTCKQFLEELNDYLDESVGADLRKKLEEHAAKCHHCYVVVDSTRKTIQVYKGLDPAPIPDDIRSRLQQALARKIAAAKQP